jgi:hypothetical protein
LPLGESDVFLISSDEDSEDELPPPSQLLSQVNPTKGKTSVVAGIRKRTFSQASMPELDPSPSSSGSGTSSGASSPSKKSRLQKAGGHNKVREISICHRGVIVSLRRKQPLFLPSSPDSEDPFASSPSWPLSSSSRASGSDLSLPRASTSTGSLLDQLVCTLIS